MHAGVGDLAAVRRQHNGAVGNERVGDVSNVVFSCGWIADDDGRLLIYYASSDTRIHVAESSIARLVDYAMHTPEDPLTSAGSVEQRYALIARNLARRDWSGHER